MHFHLYLDFDVFSLIGNQITFLTFIMLRLKKKKEETGRRKKARETRTRILNCCIVNAVFTYVSCVR